MNRKNGCYQPNVYGLLIPLMSDGTRISWAGMTRDEIVLAIELADRYGDLALLKAGRAALRRYERRREACGQWYSTDSVSR